MLILYCEFNPRLRHRISLKLNDKIVKICKLAKKIIWSRWKCGFFCVFFFLTCWLKLAGSNKLWKKMICVELGSSLPMQFSFTTLFLNFLSSVRIRSIFSLPLCKKTWRFVAFFSVYLWRRQENKKNGETCFKILNNCAVH